MAGDRRATMGNIIAQRDIEKVFPADEYSCVGIAGTAGLAVELVRLFQVELEHYEKIEGTTLSLDGKANRLATMIRGNLGDGHAGPRRRTRCSPATTSTTERRAGSSPTTSPAAATRSTAFHSVGSGSLFARGALKKLYREDLDADRRASRRCVQALYDAADDDSATGGPDLTRRIFPVVAGDHRRRLPPAARRRGRRDRRRRDRRPDDRPDGPAARPDLTGPTPPTTGRTGHR